MIVYVHERGGGFIFDGEIEGDNYKCVSKQQESELWIFSELDNKALIWTTYCILKKITHPTPRPCEKQWGNLQLCTN